MRNVRLTSMEGRPEDVRGYDRGFGLFGEAYRGGQVFEGLGDPGAGGARSVTYFSYPPISA